MNGYDFSEIPSNYQGTFQKSEDNGMRKFSGESYGNFVTEYLVCIAWDALFIDSMRKYVRVDGDPLLAFLSFIILNENHVFNFEGTAFITIQCYTSNQRKKIMLPTQNNLASVIVFFSPSELNLKLSLTFKKNIERGFKSSDTCDAVRKLKTEKCMFAPRLHPS